MQETTAGPAQGGTGSVTIADIVGLAAERYGERPAARFKRDDEWREVSYTELAATVSEIARGLVDLGLRQGERVALLCTTRVEWTYADFAITSAGAVVVPIYPTNSPEECEWVVGNTESRFVICEDAAQVAKIAAVRERLPLLEQVIAIEPAEGAICVDELRARGRSRTRARSPSGSPRSSPRTRTRSSTRPARPGRRRAACSRTATTGRSPGCARRSTSSPRARSSTSTCRWRTPTRC